MARKEKNIYFHVRTTKNVSAYFINYFLKCLFHFGSWSLKNVWITIIIISGKKKYTLQYFCFCHGSSCSSGWKVNTSLCSAAAHIFVVSRCPLGGGGGGFTPWVHKEYKGGIETRAPFKGLSPGQGWLGSWCWSWRHSQKGGEASERVQRREWGCSERGREGGQWRSMFSPRKASTEGQKCQEASVCFRRHSLP